MFEWLVGWFFPREPRLALLGSLDYLLLVVASPLAKLACSAREALLLPISCSFGSILVYMSCMLALQISWFFDLCFVIGLSVHESGENVRPYIFSPINYHN